MDGYLTGIYLLYWGGGAVGMGGWERYLIWFDSICLSVCLSWSGGGPLWCGRCPAPWWLRDSCSSTSPQEACGPKQQLPVSCRLCHQRRKLSTAPQGPAAVSAAGCSGIRDRCCTALMLLLWCNWTGLESCDLLVSMQISPEQVVLSHSPLEMMKNFHDKCVLVSGQGPVTSIAQTYPLPAQLLCHSAPTQPLGVGGTAAVFMAGLGCTKENVWLFGWRRCI